MARICMTCGNRNSDSATICGDCQSPLGTREGVGETRLSEESRITFSPGELIAGRYEVVAELGRGGMGVVYRVKDTMLRDRDMALKMIHPELVANPEARKRFEDEVSICLDLNHPAIIRVYNLERTEELHFFTMEYLAGKSLAQLITARKGGTLPLFELSEVEAIMSPLLAGLSYSHQHTIHRDLKPDNVMVQGELPNVQVKLLDFGIARTMSASRFTQTAQSMGTPYYMAPEQLQGSHDVDQRADIYSVGMILYELLTGELAVGRFPLPSEEAAELGPMDGIVERALSPLPDRRFSTIEELTHDLLAAFREIQEEVGRKHQEEEKLEREASRQRMREAAERWEVEEAERKLAEAEAKKRIEAEEEEKRLQAQKEQEAEALRQQEQEQAKREREWAEDSRRRKKKLMGLLRPVVLFGVVVATGAGGYVYYGKYMSRIKEIKAKNQASAGLQQELVAKQRQADEAERVRLAAELKARQNALAFLGTQHKATPKTADPAPSSQNLQSAPISAGKNFTDPTTGMEFVLIPYGCFEMGSSPFEENRGEDEGPVHKVCIDSFSLGKHEVTVGQWRTFIQQTGYTTDAEKDTGGEQGCSVYVDDTWNWLDGYYWNNVGFQQWNDQPVVCVSHNDAQEYILWLNNRTGRKYRLPTEAEWEYAARGGSTDSFSFGTNISTSQANYDGNFTYGGGSLGEFRKKTVSVGSFPANRFGLYDMHGNAWEWCQDWYDGNYYVASFRDNPLGPLSGTTRVIRGGSWNGIPDDLRSANRGRVGPAVRFSNLGFRLAFSGQ